MPSTNPLHTQQNPLTPYAHNPNSTFSTHQNELDHQHELRNITPLPKETLNDLTQTWGTEITRTLLMTPFVQNHLSNTTPLSTEAHSKLHATAHHLFLQRQTTSNTPLELQAIANRALGDAYNFSSWPVAVNTLKHYLIKITDHHQRPFQPSIAPHLGDLINLLKFINTQDLQKPNTQSMSQLIKLLQRISKKLTDQESPIPLTLTLFTEQLQHIHAKAIKQSRHADLKKALTPLITPGTMRERSIDLKATVSNSGSSLINLLKSSVNVGLRDHIVTLDDGLIRPARYCSPKLTTAFGDKKIAQGSFAVAYDAKWNGKAIPTLDRFIDIYAHCLTPLPASLPRVQAHGIRVALKRALKLEKRAISGSEPLATLLKHQGVLQSGDNITIEPTRLAPYAFLSHRTHGIKGVQTRAGAQTLNGLLSAELARGEVINNYNRYQDLLLASERFDSLTERATSFKEIDTRGRDDYPDDEIAQDFQQKIFSISEQFKHYCEVVNEYDFKRSLKKADKTPQAQQQIKTLRKEKHHLESTLKTHGRGGYIRQLTIEYAALQQAYKRFQSETSSATLSPMNSAFNHFCRALEDQLRQPPIYLDAVKHVQKQLSAAITADSIHSFRLGRININLGDIPFLTGSVSPEVEQLTISNYINPDLDGTYLKARLSLTAGVGLREILTRIDPNHFLMDHSATMPTFNELDWSALDGTLAADSVVEISWHRHETVDRSIEAEDKPSWQLMYIRVLAGGRIGGAARASSGPLLGPVAISGKVGVHTRRLDLVREYIGDNSLRYLQSKHNGWNMGMKTSGNDNLWKAYKEANRDQLKRLFHTIADEGSTIYLEVKQRGFDVSQLPEQRFNKAISEANALANTSFESAAQITEHFIQHCQRYRSEPTDNYFESTSSAFDQFLKMQAHETTARADARFRLK